MPNREGAKENSKVEKTSVFYGNFLCLPGNSAFEMLFSGFENKACCRGNFNYFARQIFSHIKSATCLHTHTQYIYIYIYYKSVGYD